MRKPTARPTVRWRRLSFWSWLNLAGLGVLWALENGVAERTGPTTLLLYLPQHPFLLGCAGLLAGAIVKKQRKWAAFNGAVLLVFAVILLGVHLPWARLQRAPVGAARVRVMQWNIHLAQGGPEEIARQIKALNPDIVCLEEATGEFHNGVLVDHIPALLKQFDGWHIVRASEVITLSRFPLLKQQTYQHPAPSARQVLRTAWQTPGGPLDVIAAHISTTAPGTHYGNLSPADPRRIVEIVQNARASAQARARQLPTIDRAIYDAAATGHPFVLMGDFNNPPRGLFYRHLKARLTDSFTASGLGSGFSFPAKLPLLRIDYVWLGRGVSARRSFTVPTRASDHRALVSDVDVTWN